MSAAPKAPSEQLEPALVLVRAAHDAEAIGSVRVSAAGDELLRPPALAIDDATRARAGAIVAQLVATTAAALRAAEPAFAALPEDAASARFSAARLLAQSGVGAAALRRAEEYRLAAALALGGASEEGPGARRLDPIGGSFVSESFAVRAAESARIGRTGDPLLPLADLGAEDRHALFWQVAACLADALIAVDDQPVAAVHRLAAAAVARTLAMVDESDGIAAATLTLAHALDRAQNVDDELLAGTLAEGRVASLAAMLAVRAGIGFDDADAMLADAARAALLLRACGVSREVAAAMVLALCYALDRGDGADPAARATVLLDAYAAIPPEDALAEVRRVRLDPVYRTALAALEDARC